MTLSSWDDFPVHQAPEFIAHPARAIATFTIATTSTCTRAATNGPPSSGLVSTRTLGSLTRSSMCAREKSSTLCGPRRR